MTWTGASHLCILLALLLGGCPSEWAPASGGAADAEAVGPDAAAIVTVVKDAYGAAEQRQIIFLTGAEASLADEASLRIADELGVRVLDASEAQLAITEPLPTLTPFDPATGEIGATIELGRFRQGDDGRLNVSVMVILSGRNAQGFDYVLEREGEGWRIVSVELGAVA